MNKRVRLCAVLLFVLGLALSFVMSASAEEQVTVSLNTTSIVIDLAQSSRGGTLTPVASPAVLKPHWSYSSSDRNVARVSSNGAVTGRKPGTATITVQLRGTEAYATCSVVVMDSRIPESITLDKGASITVERYQTFSLTPTVLPATADQRIKWKSSNSSVAYVNSKGVVTAKKGGTAVITCTSHRSKEVFAAITVTVNQYPSPTAISLSPDTTYMVIGSTMQLNPVTEPAGQQVCGVFTWRSSSSRVASVTDDGLVTAKTTGYVTITCTSKQNSRVKTTRKILVVTPDSPYYIQLNTTSDTVTLNPTDVMKLSSSVYPADRNQAVRWSTNRSSVVSVDDTGLITAKKAGKATVTVTSLLNKLVKAELTVNVVNLPAPDSIGLSAPAYTMEVGDTLQFTATTYPTDEKRSQEFKWSTSSSSVARIDSNGLLTARKTGTVTVTCASKRNSRVKQKVTVSIIDTKMPDSIKLDRTGDISLENGQQVTLAATVLPDTAVQTIVWKSSRSSVASVDQNGVVTALRGGTAYISATSTYSSKKTVKIKVSVTAKATPTALAFSVPQLAVYKGKQTQLALVPTPAKASTLCSYASSDSSIASIDANGYVTTYDKTGPVVITARSLKNSAAVATMTLVVYDDHTPASITLDSQAIYVGKNASQTVRASVYPATASQSVSWASANNAVATVDASGTIKGVGIGTTYVTATTSNGLKAQCRVDVTSVQVAGVIPERTTSVADISKNMAKIYAIRDSAADVISSLAVTGQISTNEAEARKAIINRAFAQQAFPWMTLSTQEYWTTKYAEKRYMPGRVYYGLPYTQQGKNGNSANRTYNVDKALAENRYYSSGSGYYILNQGNLLNGSYAGCDCSSFVNTATFGANHPASLLKTYTMNTSSYYKTLSSYKDLRPGDHLVLAKSHVVMFLYWMNAEKTQFMIIEQGGDGNTVICSIKDAAFYANQRYIPRRVRTFN